MGVPNSVILHPNFLAEDELINDTLNFTKGISCDFHEELEAMRHFSLSYVQRWSFRIMEQCCGPGNRNYYRKALRFKYLSYQESVPALKDSLLEIEHCPS
jgi:hypothetical protein